MFLDEKGTLTQIRNELGGITTSDMSKILTARGYNVKGGNTASKIKAIKNAVDDYISNINNYPNLQQISAKYGIDHHIVSKEIKKRGYEILDFCHFKRFNEHVFDVIDTEEKAYWLGFIYADGCISLKSNTLEISLKYDDVEHLNKFNVFMQHVFNNVKERKVKCNEKLCKVCRWMGKSKHLCEVLNSYGCTPKKSLTLTFPNENIFTDKKLIKDFLRGYFDGDGCITYVNKEHTHTCISVLGTEEFLTQFAANLPIKSYKLRNNSKTNSITKTLSLSHRKAFNVINYLYKNSNIYLDRKYQRYLDACRHYEKS